MQERRKGPDTRSAETIAAVEDYRRIFNEFLGSRGASAEEIALRKLSACLMYDRFETRATPVDSIIGPHLRSFLDGEKRQGELYINQLFAQTNRLIISGWRDSDPTDEFEQNVCMLIHVGKREILLPSNQAKKIPTDAIEDLNQFMKSFTQLPISSLHISHTPLDLNQKFKEINRFVVRPGM